MKKPLLAAITLALGACSAPTGESISDELPAASPLEDGPIVLDGSKAREPDGVVLDDGTVITEEEARTGLTPKAVAFINKRLVGSTSVSSSSTLSGATPTSHICALSMIWGTLYGTGSQVRVTTNSTNWFMTTFPMGNPERVAMETICYPLSAFSGTAPGWQVFAPSPEFVAKITAPADLSVNMWKSDAAPIITGVGGRFVGAGEFAQTRLLTNTQLLAKVMISSLQGDVHMTWARSFFVGVPGGNHVPQFIGPNGTGSLATAGEWSITFDADSEFNSGSVLMAGVNEAFCFLTGVTGRWGNKDSWIQIIKEGPAWKLHGSATGSNRVDAFAACYALQQ